MVTDTKLCILTFYTEGPPFDAGEDLSAAERTYRNTFQSAADSYLAFSPRTLITQEPRFDSYFRNFNDWLNRHPHSNELTKFNRAWASLGFQIWKPHLIKFILDSSDLREGDLLFYHDVNCLKYPHYLNRANDLKKFSLDILRRLKTDLFFPSGFNLKYDVKSDLIRRFLGEYRFDDLGLWSGLILLRKSSLSREFVNEWIELSSSLDNLAPLPNPDPHPDKENYLGTGPDIL